MKFTAVSDFCPLVVQTVQRAAGGEYSIRRDRHGFYHVFYRAPWESEQVKVGDAFCFEKLADARWFIERYAEGREEWRALKKQGQAKSREFLRAVGTSARDRSSEGADKTGEDKMDMRQFAGSSFITVESLRDGSREEKLVSVAPGKYDKPVATFESGDQLGLNKTNVRTLMDAYGEDSRDWVGCTVELYVGDLKYNGEIQEGVLVRPISPPMSLAARTPVPKTPRGKDMDDDIPF